MAVPHSLQRTVLPRAVAGTESTFLQVSLGHMILTVSGVMSGSDTSPVLDRPELEKA